MSFLEPLPETHKENMQEIARRPRNKYVKWSMLFAIIATGIITSINAVNSDQSISIFQIIVMPFSIMLVNCMISPFSRGMFLGMFINPPYDEYEIAALNRARHISLWIINGLVISLCAWCYFGAVIDIPHPITARNWISVAMCFLVIPPLLPAVIAEWIIPLPPEGDEE